MNLSKLSGDWLTDLRAARKSPRTVHVYGQAVKSFVRLAGDDLEHVTRHEIRRWLAELGERSVAASERSVAASERFTTRQSSCCLPAPACVSASFAR